MIRLMRLLKKFLDKIYRIYPCLPRSSVNITQIFNIYMNKAKQLGKTFQTDIIILKFKNFV